MYYIYIYICPLKYTHACTQLSVACSSDDESVHSATEELVHPTTDDQSIMSMHSTQIGISQWIKDACVEIESTLDIFSPYILAV